MITLLAYLDEVQTSATRDASYQAVIQLGGSQREVVYEFVREHPEGVTNQDINIGLFHGKKINVVCARINELRKLDRIIVGGTRTNEQTGMHNVYWIVK